MVTTVDRPIGQMIRTARQRLGMSQYALAERLATISGKPTMGRDRVARWERGRQVPRAEWRRWLSAVLEVPQEQLDAGAAATRRQNRLGSAAIATPPSHAPKTTRRMQGTPALLPIFRSRVAAGVLAATLLNPERAFSLTELAEHAGASLASVSKEAELLADAGILTTRNEGAIRLTQAASNTPVLAPLTELIRLTYGVPQVIAEEFGHVRGVDRIALTGSWAERFAGIVGPEPHKVQLRLIGDPHHKPHHQALSGAAARASRRLRRPVEFRVVPAPPSKAEHGTHTSSTALAQPAPPPAPARASNVPHQRQQSPLVHVEPTPPPAGPQATPDYRAPGAESIDQLVETRQLELIGGAAADESPYLDLAANHLSAAEQVVGSAPGSAFILLCQAAQLIGSGLLAAQGLRPAPGTDTAVITRAVTAQFGAQFAQIERLRQRMLVLNTPVGRDNRVTADDVNAHLPAIREMLSKARDIVPELALYT
ncbi:hypothetical protein EF847_13795 [Actinobacteria bacterium YIM 96077]|uniref:HTH cro/C1-type domain-containing protein n=1 Tax=Phytoactinopolyspora halophila TaxID=1981511 RepID=A0A329QE66_9ACTN|nr:helix-turn-helix domain-containing protein [Phytoactinopolyspora halophila]AYY13609.1 hypothetical protein EF847_13795 [Actinobacteria bacterium YIM 96077]RAW10725.1 hypothetical protein DPM12_18525 [Phytoactinopolyspora halophila]